MIKIRAKIKLYKGKGKRQTPFTSGYRPLFEFIQGMKTSGQITLNDRLRFAPGEEGIVEIVFLNRKYLGNSFKPGLIAKFYEAKEPLGEAKVLEIL